MLADLDELVLTCTDPQSRAYIKEAVICYKNGAYRSAVVATWIGIAFDLIDKIRFLSSTGDAEATKAIESFDRISSSGDIVAALRFEKQLLDLAKDKLELISHAEYLDLKRISEDRNRCAHPSHTLGTTVFEPPAELARLHIFNAVNFLLSQQPAQGKSTLERLTKDIESESFPNKEKEIKTYLKAGPLGRPRKSLLRNIFVLLLKGLIDPTKDYKSKDRFNLIIKCLVDLHPVQGRNDLQVEANKLISNADDNTLLAAIKIFREHFYYSLLDETQQIRLRSRVESLPDSELGETDFLMSTPLEEAANARLKVASADIIIEIPWFNDAPQAAINKVIFDYRFSRNYATANKIGYFLRRNAASLTDKHVESIIDAASNNSEVKHSIEFGKILNEIAGKSTTWKARINALLRKHAIELCIE